MYALKPLYECNLGAQAVGSLRGVDRCSGHGGKIDRSTGFPFFSLYRQKPCTEFLLFKFCVERTGDWTHHARVGLERWYERQSCPK